MKFTPEPYQVVARDFLLANEQAGLFAGLGLGKSAITLSALNRLFAGGDIRSALVVAPLRVARLTWPNEVEKWDDFRWMKVEFLRGMPRGTADLYTINYESLHKLTSLNFCDVVIFDELTRAKNPQSKRIAALSRLLHHHRRWGLTGTPRPNSLLELFAQIRLLDDGLRLGRSFSQFRSAYFVAQDWNEYNWLPKPGTEEKVYAKIADLTLTLRSGDYTDVAETQMDDVEVALPDEAKDAYATLEKDLLLRLEGSDVVAVNAAVLTGKLLQVTGGTVYDEFRRTIEVHDAKIKALRKLLSRHKGENVLVACNYIHERRRLVRSVVGTVDAGEFEEDIEAAWNDSKIKVLVADPRSLGHGLNLQLGGRIIVWFGLPYSRELYDQFNARVARKGQAEQPLVYRLLCPGTIDEAVAEVLSERGRGQNEMLAILSNLRKIVDNRESV